MKLPKHLLIGFILLITLAPMPSPNVHSNNQVFFMIIAPEGTSTQSVDVDELSLVTCAVRYDDYYDLNYSIYEVGHEDTLIAFRNHVESDQRVFFIGSGQFKIVVGNNHNRTQASVNLFIDINPVYKTSSSNHFVIRETGADVFEYTINSNLTRAIELKQNRYYDTTFLLLQYTASCKVSVYDNEPKEGDVPHFEYYLGDKPVTDRLRFRTSSKWFTFQPQTEVPITILLIFESVTNPPLGVWDIILITGLIGSTLVFIGFRTHKRRHRSQVDGRQQISGEEVRKQSILSASTIDPRNYHAPYIPPIVQERKQKKQ